MKKIIHPQEYVCDVAPGVRPPRAPRQSQSNRLQHCEKLATSELWWGRGRPHSAWHGVQLISALLVIFMAALATGAETTRKTIFIVGDSIAAGHGVDPEEAFPGLIRHRINEKKLPFEVVNAGVSGDTTAGGVRRMPWLLKRKMDVLVLELGGNDGLRGITPKETKANLEKIIDLAREKNPDVQIILAGMQMPQNMGEEYTREYREAFPAVAKGKQVKLIPFLLEGVGGKADLNLPDRIHPNPAGHKIIADTVWAVLQPLLSSDNKAEK
jgi:acyl-CoA thioesterase-1